MKVSERDVQPGSERAREPTCPDCGGKLLETGGGQVSGPAGVLLLAVGLATWGLMPYFQVQVMLAAGGAAVMMGVILLRRKMWWECTGCGRRYRRSLPPRGYGETVRAEREE